MMPYTVSKHGVVAMTRTLAIEKNNIQHKAICPAWTDTNIVATSTAASKAVLNAHIQSMGGLMTPEYVAEGFYRLATQCGNGDTMVIVKGAPYVVMPDYSMPMLRLFFILAKLVDRVTGAPVVNGTHFAFALPALIMMFLYLVTIIF